MPAEAAAPADKVVVNDLEIRYERAGLSVTAIQGLTLSVRDGEFVAIVGQSGCGKSTLLKAIDGLIPMAAGHIEVDGRRVTRPGPSKAMVFQDGRLLPWRSVLGNITLPLEARGVSRSEARERAMALIERVGLSRFAKAFPNQLSGGMQQRVNLARALVVNPQVLLLDEPFAALDDVLRQQLNEELVRIWTEQGWTALFVTHNVAEAVFLSHRILVMSARPGTIIADIPVPFAYPRPPELRAEPEFAWLAGQVSGRLREAA
jgi:NitT/TauT family transport system ATP-binding protein